MNDKWHLENDEDSDYFIVVDEHGQKVVSLHNERRANLLATAPELLDHLDSMLESWYLDELDEWEIAIAARIVKKAKGQ